jgi:hypothetical protein
MSHQDSIRAILKSQYHASLAMLRDAIERCPDEVWTHPGHKNAFWQLAYHVLYYTHLYLHVDEAAFRPWERHQGRVQSESALTGPPDPSSTLPLLPEPYTRADVLAYWQLCDQMVDGAVDAFDLDDPASGFWWYEMSKLEHQFINIRHIQHHAAQLADRLRSAADISIDWVSAGRSD